MVNEVSILEQIAGSLIVLIAALLPLVLLSWLSERERQRTHFGVIWESEPAVGRTYSLDYIMRHRLPPLEEVL